MGPFPTTERTTCHIVMYVLGARRRQNKDSLAVQGRRHGGVHSKKNCQKLLSASTEPAGSPWKLPVFCPGFQKGRVPSEKGTFSAVSGPSKGHI